MPAPRPEVVAPVIHLNGTSAERLKEALDDFYVAIGEAADKLAACGPNGRDYYPDPGRMDLAVAQHRRRFDVLRALQDEIEAEMEAIDAQRRDASESD